MHAKKLKIFSFFSGSGFLDLGFELNGFSIDLVNEFYSPFIKAYQYSREKMGISSPRYGYFNIDINEFLGARSNELLSYVRNARIDGSFVGFIGGPPCPDFSIAGKNKGCEGDNGKLSLSYINLIIDMQPDFFLFENVKGLWKTARHREFFEQLKSMLQEAGYCTTERLSNALEYGAPQDRDRILLFGIHESIIDDPQRIATFPWERYQCFNLNEVKDMPWPGVEPFTTNSVTLCPPNIPEQLTVEYWFRKNEVEKHPNAFDFFEPRSGLQRIETIDEGDVCKKSYKRLHRWRYSPTVAYGNNEVHLHPYKARRISAAEAMSLQTLPRVFELPSDMTLTDKFKTIGNGVPYVLAKGIALTLRSFLDELADKV